MVKCVKHLILPSLNTLSQRPDNDYYDWPVVTCFSPQVTISIMWRQYKITLLENTSEEDIIPMHLFGHLCFLMSLTQGHIFKQEFFHVSHMRYVRKFGCTVYCVQKVPTCLI